MTEGRIIPPGEVLPPLGVEPKHAKADGSNPGKRKGRKNSEAAGRFAVLNGFVDCGMVGLSRAEIAVWLVLYRDTRNGTARTSVEDIGQRIGTSKRGVLDALGKLRKLGLVTRVYKGGLNRGPSTYRVHPMPQGGP